MLYNYRPISTVQSASLQCVQPVTLIVGMVVRTFLAAVAWRKSRVTRLAANRVPPESAECTEWTCVCGCHAELPKL